LCWEYLDWANTRLNQEYGINLEIEIMVERDMAKLDIFLPPDGRLLLAVEGAQAAGLACMRRIGERTGEIKRMYARPEFRKQGINRALVEALIAEAWAIG
jgi:GNAT superfamily N-acetyltransferase